jgi:hypothetical protein
LSDGVGPIYSHAFVESAAQAVPDAIEKSTVAIVASAGGVVSQLASGFLLAIADARFVVTAAHVLDQAIARQAVIGVTARPYKFAVPRSDWIRSTPPDPGAHDFLDVAIYKLPDSELERFDVTRFLRLSDLCFDRKLDNGYFLLCGFPNLWSTTADQATKTINFKMIQYSGPEYSGDVVGLAFYDRENHLLIEADEENSFAPDGREMHMRTRSGFRAPFPGDLKGASGCGVWQIGSLSAPASTWTSQDAKLIGFFTATYTTRRLIRATRCWAITTAVWNAYPELRGAIKLHA